MTFGDELAYGTNATDFREAMIVARGDSFVSDVTIPLTD
jgi:hypothetical protein